MLAVEYQGAAVRIALKTETGEEAAVVMPDHAFYAAPVEPGAATNLIWSAEDERPLAA